MAEALARMSRADAEHETNSSNSHVVGKRLFYRLLIVKLGRIANERAVAGPAPGLTMTHTRT
jgi:hypothetical protein